jgi:hypothetical protein
MKENCQEIELYIVFSILFLLSTKKKNTSEKSQGDDIHLSFIFHVDERS